MNKITIQQIELIAASLAKKRPSFNQLVCDFTQRPAGVLESCLRESIGPQKHKTLQQSLSAQAASIFYLINKNKPFKTGNKRIALATVLYFMSINGKWLAVDSERLLNIAQWVAASPQDAKEELVQYIEKFIKKNMMNLT